MAFTPEEETALRALIAQDPKIISDLEAETGLNGDEVFPVEDGSGTFAVSVNDVKNYSEKKIQEGALVATAAGTTTLTSASAPTQIFTGSTTQTVKLPDVSTLYVGKRFEIRNLSTGVVTVQSSGSNTLQAMAASSRLIAICIAITGTGTASWTWSYSYDLSYLSSAELKTGTDTLKIPNAATILAALGFTAYGATSQQTITSAGSLTIAHGLSRTPILYIPFLVCTDAGGEAGYSQNQETLWPAIDLNSAGAGSFLSIVPDGTNLNVRFGNNSQYVNHKTTGVATGITLSKWKLVIRYWA